MTDNPIVMTTHPDYDAYVEELQKVEDCVEGAARIKSQKGKYYPNPSQVDTTSKQSIARHSELIANAEFDEQPSDTLHTMLGKMRIAETECELPERLDYLIEDSDGDGQNMSASIEYAVSGVIKHKYQAVIADYQGLSGVDLESVSLADMQELNPRAVLKHYKRQHVVNWYYARVNGRMQLAWVCLLETGDHFDPETMEHDEVQSYLILGLDENGDYYQEKRVRGAVSQDGEREYVQVGGKPLKFIPIEIISDQEQPSGAMPKGTGFLSRICNASLDKYRMSGVYKEVLRNLSPTLITSGWKRGDKDLFKDMNGRDYLAMGGNQTNNLPAGVTYDLLSADVAVDPYQWYLEYSDKKILSMGGVAKQEAMNMTATEADINAAEQNAKLKTIADNVESAFERLIAYCGMFEGLVRPEEVMKQGDIIVSLPRDFATPKLSVEEVKVMIELKNAGEMSPEEFDRQMKKGGWRSKDMELTDLEEAPPLARVNTPIAQQE